MENVLSAISINNNSKKKNDKRQHHYSYNTPIHHLSAVREIAIQFHTNNKT